MSNSFGFGGTDTVLVFAAPEAFPEPPTPARQRVVITGASTVGALGVRGGAESAAYVEPGPTPAEGPVAFNPAEHLDVPKARRLDRAGRLTTVAIQEAIRDGGLDLASASVVDGTGAIFGASFGSVDASTAFMRRIYDKGAKYASPADFPNLVPSSPVGHASIYLGLRGPVFAMADLGATAESTIEAALELLQVGEADAMVAGSVEEASPMIERCLGPICTGIEVRGVRAEGASAVLLEREEAARGRGAKVLARVAWWAGWRGDGAASLEGLPGPGEGDAWVLMGRADDRLRALVAASPWAGRPEKLLAPRAGDHEGAGGFAVVAAASAIAAGTIRRALVLGGAPDRAYALVLEAASPSDG
jgi:3-oxoacyl-[acyl-carrier-protein] synthase II